MDNFVQDDDKNKIYTVRTEPTRIWCWVQWCVVALDASVIGTGTQWWRMWVLVPVRWDWYNLGFVRLQDKQSLKNTCLYKCVWFMYVIYICKMISFLIWYENSRRLLHNDDAYYPWIQEFCLFSRDIVVAFSLRFRECTFSLPQTLWRVGHAQSSSSAHIYCSVISWWGKSHFCFQRCNMLPSLLLGDPGTHQ